MNSFNGTSEVKVIKLKFGTDQLEFHCQARCLACEVISLYFYGQMLYLTISKSCMSYVDSKIISRKQSAIVVFGENLFDTNFFKIIFL